MKLCPHCKAAIDENARFCLCCMTPLDTKEQIAPPVRKSRRWPLVLLCFLLSVLTVLMIFRPEKPKADIKRTPPSTASRTEPTVAIPSNACTHTVDGVRYTFRPATKEDHPTAIALDNYYVLIRVEGAPADGLYRVPTFVGDDTNALVTVIADGAFEGTDARKIDLGRNVRYVWGNAFGGASLTDLYLHTDVFIDRAAFSGCKENFTIHCPSYLENTEGSLWFELAEKYGFRWQSIDL